MLFIGMTKIKYTNEHLEKLVKESVSIAEVLRKLGYSSCGGGTHTILKQKIEKLKLDTSHFTGQKWSAGKTKLDDDRIRTRVSREHIFCEDSLESQSVVRKYLIRYNLVEYKCGECEITEWKGTSLVLELHHKNGNNSDNRMENLIFLCPNCHSITPSFKNKQNKRRLTQVSDDDILQALKESQNIRQICRTLQIRADGDNYGMIRRRLRMLGVNL